MYSSPQQSVVDGTYSTAKLLAPRTNPTLLSGTSSVAASPSNCLGTLLSQSYLGREPSGGGGSALPLHFNSNVLLRSDRSPVAPNGPCLCTARKPAARCDTSDSQTALPPSVNIGLFRRVSTDLGVLSEIGRNHRTTEKWVSQDAVADERRGEPLAAFLEMESLESAATTAAAGSTTPPTPTGVVAAACEENQPSDVATSVVLSTTQPKPSIPELPVVDRAALAARLAGKLKLFAPPPQQQPVTAIRPPSETAASAPLSKTVAEVCVTRTEVAAALAENLKFPLAATKSSVNSAPVTLNEQSTANVAFSAASTFQLPGKPPGRSPKHRVQCENCAFPGRPPGPPPSRRPSVKTSGFQFPGTPPGRVPGSKIHSFPAKPPGRAPGWQNRKSAVAVGGSKGKFLARDPLLAQYFPSPPQGFSGKRFSWGVIAENKLKGTIWEQLIQNDLKLPHPTFSTDRTKATDDSTKNTGASSVRFAIDYDKIVELFFENENDRKKEQNSRHLPGGTKDKKLIDDTVRVLDAKRRQNLEICLKGQGLLDDMSGLLSTVEDLVGIDGSEPYLVSQEVLEIVLTLLPTPEEERALQAQLQKHDVTQFAKAEQFLVRLLGIPKFKQRAEACIFAMSYEKDVQYLETRAKRFRTAMNRLLATVAPGGALHSVLALILRLGNFLNQGTRKGDARGFTVDSLSQLKTLKSLDGSTTLLRVAAETIEAQRPAAWEELQKALSVHAGSHAGDFSLDDMSALLLRLQQKTARTEAVAKELSGLHDGKATKASQLFSSICAAANKRLAKLESALNEIEQQLSKLAELFGVKTKNTAEAMTVLSRLGSFWKELFAARQENQERIAREARKTAATSKKRLSQSSSATLAIAAASVEEQQHRKPSDPSIHPITNEMLAKINAALKTRASVTTPANGAIRRATAPPTPNDRANTKAATEPRSSAAVTQQQKGKPPTRDTLAQVQLRPVRSPPVAEVPSIRPLKLDGKLSATTATGLPASSTALVLSPNRRSQPPNQRSEVTAAATQPNPAPPGTPAAAAGLLTAPESAPPALITRVSDTGSHPTSPNLPKSSQQQHRQKTTPRLHPFPEAPLRPAAGPNRGCMLVHHDARATQSPHPMHEALSQPRKSQRRDVTPLGCYSLTQVNYDAGTSLSSKRQGAVVAECGIVSVVRNKSSDSLHRPHHDGSGTARNGLTNSHGLHRGTVVQDRAADGNSRPMDAWRTCEPKNALHKVIDPWQNESPTVPVEYVTNKGVRRQKSSNHPKSFPREFQRDKTHRAEPKICWGLDLDSRLIATSDSTGDDINGRIGATVLNNGGWRHLRPGSDDHASAAAKPQSTGGSSSSRRGGVRGMIIKGVTVFGKMSGFKAHREGAK